MLGNRSSHDCTSALSGIQAMRITNPSDSTQEAAGLVDADDGVHDSQRNDILKPAIQRFNTHRMTPEDDNTKMTPTQQDALLAEIHGCKSQHGRAQEGAAHKPQASQAASCQQQRPKPRASAGQVATPFPSQPPPPRAPPIHNHQSQVYQTEIEESEAADSIQRLKYQHQRQLSQLEFQQKSDKQNMLHQHACQMQELEQQQQLQQQQRRRQWNTREQRSAAPSNGNKTTGFPGRI